MSGLVGWLGGGAFAATLALCAWWYFVTLDRVVRGFHPPALAYDAALLTIFAAHHSLFARDAIKRRLTAIPPHLQRTLYVWIASALLAAVVVLWRPIGGELYQATGAAKAVHLVLQVSGAAMIYGAVADLDPLELAGIREAAGLSRRRDSLQEGGPYRFVRHPLYLGWTLVLFATSHMTADRFAFAALTSVYLVIAIPFEERSLIRTFGDEYLRYRSRVRWRMIPFLY